MWEFDRVVQRRPAVDSRTGGERAALRRAADDVRPRSVRGAADRRRPGAGREPCRRQHRRRVRRIRRKRRVRDRIRDVHAARRDGARTGAGRHEHDHPGGAARSVDDRPRGRRGRRQRSRRKRCRRGVAKRSAITATRQAPAQDACWRGRPPRDHVRPHRAREATETARGRSACEATLSRRLIPRPVSSDVRVSRRDAGRGRADRRGSCSSTERCCAARWVVLRGRSSWRPCCNRIVEGVRGGGGGVPAGAGLRRPGVCRIPRVRRAVVDTPPADADADAEPGPSARRVRRPTPHRCLAGRHPRGATRRDGRWWLNRPSRRGRPRTADGTRDPREARRTLTFVGLRARRGDFETADTL